MVFAAFWREALLADEALIGIDWTCLFFDGVQGEAPLGEENRGSTD